MKGHFVLDETWQEVRCRSLQKDHRFIMGGLDRSKARAPQSILAYRQRRRSSQQKSFGLALSGCPWEVLHKKKHVLEVKLADFTRFGS